MYTRTSSEISLLYNTLLAYIRFSYMSSTACTALLVQKQQQQSSSLGTHWHNCPTVYIPEKLNNICADTVYCILQVLKEPKKGTGLHSSNTGESKNNTLEEAALSYPTDIGLGRMTHYLVTLSYCIESCWNRNVSQNARIKSKFHSFLFRSCLSANKGLKVLGCEQLKPLSIQHLFT